MRRSQWPRGLRRRSSAARQLRSWVQIPSRAWMFFCCDCCVLSGRGLCDGLITRPEESYRLWRVVVCDQETSKTRRLKPATGLWKIQPQWVVTPGKQTNIYICTHNYVHKLYIYPGTCNTFHIHEYTQKCVYNIIFPFVVINTKPIFFIVVPCILIRSEFLFTNKCTFY